MIDDKPQPTRLEDISAGLLSGAMVTLLACGFAAVVAWQIVAQLTGWLPDLQAMSVSLPGEDFKAIATRDHDALIRDGLAGGAMILLALGIGMRGVRHIQKNLTLLRARRG
ncbi:hypothetical protein J2800_003953 [Caulobacter rhizosphaerae]|jgi:hypothetical protein|uniref:Uncharacterized protein n=1 Tax=Caulobacter rhizosphaerae TaxID=2010972 RepID=A0ABU1N5G9_9CAUL|nr:hypothetical protein [Caulobacter rhizosphaerae]MDR6533191.1 hypothetical protein [Caulobacter rhizosphaerae]